MDIVRDGYYDPTQWDPHDKHYDAKTSEENPRWHRVSAEVNTSCNWRLSSPKLMHTILVMFSRCLLQVDVAYNRHLKREILLDELKTHKEGALSDMVLFRWVLS